MGALKMRDWNLRDWNLQDWNLRHKRG